MKTNTYATATELAAAIRARRVSACEIVEAHLDRISAVNPTINAVVTLDAEHALERAKAADEALSRGESWGPLHGVPFTLKDAHATAGMRTTVGTAELDHMPTQDGTAMRRNQSRRVLHDVEILFE